jgi:hypothetical protein
VSRGTIKRRKKEKKKKKRNTRMIAHTRVWGVKEKKKKT